MQVAVIEPIWRGHTPGFFLTAARAFLDHGCEVRLVCPAPESIATLLQAEGYAASRIFLSRCEPHSGATAARFSLQGLRSSYLDVIRTALADAPRCDLWYFNLIDPLLRNVWANLARFVDFNVPFSGLYMHPPLRVPGGRALARGERLHLLSLRLAFARKCPALLTLDEGVLAPLSAQLGLPILHHPEMTVPPVPALVSPETKELAQQTQGTFTVLLAGIQAAWKGVPLAIETAIRTRHLPISWIFAGEPAANPQEAASIATEIARARELGARIHTLQQRLPDELYEELFLLADLVWCLYPKHIHSSNTLSKAATYGVPTIAPLQGLIAERVTTYRLGVTCAADAETVATSVERLAIRPFVFDEKLRAEFLEVHSTDKVRQSIGKLLERFA